MPFAIIAPPLEAQEKFLWAEYTRADLDDVHALFQELNHADDADHSESVQDLATQFDDPWLEPRVGARVIRDAFGKLRAFVRVFVNPKPERENLAVVDWAVAPEWRGQGLEEEILAWSEDNASRRLAQAASLAPDENIPAVIRVSALASESGKIKLYQTHGYRNVRAFYKMQRSLRDLIPDAPLADGLVLREYDESLDEKMCQAYNEAFEEHWGHITIPQQEWQPFVMGVSTVRRDLTFVVMDGDALVAFCINCERVAENERLNIRRGWTTRLGTRPAWRKRGLATFLLAESMRRFRAEGFEFAGLGVDAENDTGALALYERLGYRAYKTRFMFEKRAG
jgi:ribosomal protein S18 acetylase RimI-like enzyme